MKSEVNPVAQHTRRVPFNLREKFEQRVQELEQMDIIEKVQGPTTWVGPIAAVPKPSGEIRLCVGMRKANKAIVRERHPIPTVDEVLQDMIQSSVFSKLDLKWGYHQLELRKDTEFGDKDRERKQKGKKIMLIICKLLVNQTSKRRESSSPATQFRQAITII